MLTAASAAASSLLPLLLLATSAAAAGGLSHSYLIVYINLVGHHKRGYPPAMLLQLFIPELQVLVSDFSGDIKHHDASMGPVVV